MSAFVAVVATTAGEASLPESCVRQLALPGAGAIRWYSVPGFSCAVAPLRTGDPGIFADGSCVVAGDVRLDDRRSLISALGGSVAGAGTVSEHLVLVVAAYSAWGEAAFGRLRGDFSVVLWDARTRTAHAVRDGLGVRPLYYSGLAGGMVASNVINAVRAHPAVPDTLHAPAVASFLACGFNLDSTTSMFASIARLAPGTHLTVDADVGATRIARHWSIPDPAPIRFRRADDYVERYRDLLGQAVADRVDPAGTMILLSGGLDSTSIAATARRIAPDARLHALTMREPRAETAADMALATEVAQWLGLPHIRVEELSDTRLDAAASLPEPLVGMGMAGFQGMLAKVAPVASVVLGGEDGDALFHPAGLAAMLRTDSVGRTALRILAYMIRHGRRPYMGFWLARRLRGSQGGRLPQSPPWIRPAVRALVPADTATVTSHRARPEAARSLTSPLWQAVHAGADRSYHGATVEFRWPLLDQRLIEFVFAIPSIPWCQQKYLVRRAFAADLPPAVVARPKTPARGYLATVVRGWQELTGASLPQLDSRTLEYVDPVGLGAALRSPDLDAVIAGWRALALDQWVRRAECP
ncbi:MAG: hypothetical protein IT356_04145 [Gemmatimonadaceae bacterium]|nr:hypothetical protein [Gemmatimonadaceae bacterium]